MDLLIKSGADVNTRTDLGESPLLAAAFEGRIFSEQTKSSYHKSIGKYVFLFRPIHDCRCAD